MAWSTPVTWAVNQLVRAADLNTYVNNNLNYLYSRKNAVTSYDAGTFTTNTNVFQQVGTASVSLTTIGNPVFLLAQITGLENSNVTHKTMLQWFNVTTSANVGSEFHAKNVDMFPVTLGFVEDGLAAGSYTWQLRWKVSNVNTTGTLTNIRLQAVEIL